MVAAEGGGGGSYSLLMRRPCFCEQRENKEHEDNKHGKSDPEADDNGV